MHETEATTMVSLRGQQAVGRAVPQPLDLVVDRGVLLDVGVGLRDVRLWLVVVVVGDEVLHRVVRHHLAQLVGELGGERLVRHHDEHGALQLLGHPGDGGRLAGAGRAEQHRVLLPVGDPLGDLGDRGRLVTGRGHLGDDLERRHLPLQVGYRTHDASSNSSVVRPLVPVTAHRSNSTAGVRHSAAARGAQPLAMAARRACSRSRSTQTATAITSAASSPGSTSTP